MSDSNALVSVVVPVFNRADLIMHTLDSVLEQSYRPLEIVVVDDGSSDESAAVVQSWIENVQDQTISTRLIRQKNSGANAARNTGIDAAQGCYIAFLDSDDRWLEDKLTRQIALFDQGEEIGGVYCGLRNVDLASGEKEPLMPREYPSGDISRAMLISDITAPTSCWVVRKSCFEAVGKFDIELPARQDWDMWIRLSGSYSIEVVPDVLVEMGNHLGERVRSDGNREIRAHQIIYRKYAAQRARHPFWLSLAARSAMYRRRGRVYFHRGMSMPKAFAMQFAAIVTWPFNFDSYAALIGMLLPRNTRKKLNHIWNRVFGKTRLGIKTH